MKELGSAGFAAVSLEIGVGLLWLAIWRNGHTMAKLERAAARKGYQVIEARRALVRFGPFYPATRTEPIFRIRLVAADGRQRTGWARVELWWSGPGPSRIVDIRLDPEDTATAATPHDQGLVDDVAFVGAEVGVDEVALEA